MIKFTFLFIILWWLIVKPRTRKEINTYIVICGILFTAMIGLRNEAIFGDTFAYVYYFEQLESSSLQDTLAIWEKDQVFWIMSYILYPVLMGKYTLWLLLFALAVMFPFLKLVRKYSVDPMYSWILFVFLGFMFFFMAGVRQTLGIALTTTGFVVLLDNNIGLNKRRIWFIALVVIASLFHGSAIICLLGLLFVNRPINQWSIILYFAILIICFIYGSQIMPLLTSFVGQYDERYLGYGEDLEGSTITYFLQQLIILLPSVYVLRKRLKEPLISTLFHFAIIGLIFVSLSIVIAEMFRVSFYFSWANLVLFPMAINKMRKNNPYIPVMYLAFFILYLVFINKSGWQDYYFFFEDTSFILNTYDMSEL